MNEKNILIFCDGFMPPAYNPRIRYFFSYFEKKGWNVTLAAEKHREKKYLFENQRVEIFDYYKYQKGFLQKIEYALKFLLNLFYDYKGRFFLKKIHQVIENQQFDLIFCCCSFNSSPLTLAAKIAKKLNIPFFADLRDIFEQAPDNEYVVTNKPPAFIGKFIVNLHKKINIKRRNNALKKAQTVTTISSWHVNFLKKINPNTHLIYNGFDENLFVENVKKNDKFVISFFGCIYNENLRNPKILFAALKNLYNKNLITPKNFVVKWFIDEKSKLIIEKIAQQFSIFDLMEYKNFLPQENLPNEMNNSSILLSLCNSSKNQIFGMMTTKFFEYIGVNRPILCTPNNNDELAETINAIGCGSVSSDVSEVENFIMEKYNEWQKNGFTQGSVSTENRKKFSRKNGAKILEKLFLEALK